MWHCATQNSELHYRFIPEYINIATLFIKFVRKKKTTSLNPFRDEEHQAFGIMINSIASAPVHALRRTNPPFLVDAGTSHLQLRAALLNTYSDEERKQLGFWSRSLITHENNYSTTTKNAMQLYRPSERWGSTFNKWASRRTLIMPFFSGWWKFRSQAKDKLDVA